MARLAVSPKMAIHVVKGHLRIHTGASSRNIVCDDSLLLLVLSRFTVPTEEKDVIESLEMRSRQEVGAAINALKRIGALVPSEETDQDRRLDEHRLGLVLLAPLAQTIHRLASEIEALGPFAAEQLSDKAGGGLALRLATLLGQANGLQSELRQLREAYIKEQVEDLDIDLERGLKLNLGAGRTPIPGWVNVDLFPVQLALDLTWGLPFAPGAADYVYMSHVLEHFHYPGEVLNLLRDLHCVLSKTGTLRVVVPDIKKCILAYAEGDKEFFESRKEVWTWWPESQSHLESFLSYAGAGALPGSFMRSHKFGFNFETLAKILRKAGFSEVRQSEYMQSEDSVLRLDNVSDVASAKYGDKYYSLFVEASP